MAPNRPPFRPAAKAVRFALPKAMDPATAADMLERAQQAMFNLLTGTMPNGVETPGLGRVTFADTNVADLQRLIDYLSGIVATGGQPANVRKPISFYGWP